MARKSFLGLDFDAIGPIVAAQRIAMRARQLAPFVYVATANVDRIACVDRNPKLRLLHDAAWLNLCGSRTLEIFAELSRIHMPAAPAADIANALLRDHIHRDDAITIIGGSQLMVDTLRDRFGLTAVNWFDAQFWLEDDATVRAQCAAFICANPAPFVFLAINSPQQEMIAREVTMSGGATGVAICCGASLEALTREAPQAPGWMRANGLQWLHRLRENPALIWRYVVDGLRIADVWRRREISPGRASAALKGVAATPG